MVQSLPLTNLQKRTFVKLFFLCSFISGLWNITEQCSVLELATSFPSCIERRSRCLIIFSYCTPLSGPVRKAYKHSSTISYAWRNIRRGRGRGRGGDTNSEIAHFFAPRERSPLTARSSLPENRCTAVLWSVDSMKKPRPLKYALPKISFKKKKNLLKVASLLNLSSLKLILRCGLVLFYFWTYYGPHLWKSVSAILKPAAAEILSVKLKLRTGLWAPYLLWSRDVVYKITYGWENLTARAGKVGTIYSI